MQINRLFEIIYILLEKKTITAKELAEYFGVSIRTIYRDVDVLSTAKIPVYMNKGKGGGIRLLEDFVLDKSILTDEEQNQILFALQGMQQMRVSGEKDILEKMSMLFQKNKANWIEVDLSNWSNVEGQDKTFELIRKAVLEIGRAHV